VLKEDTMTMKQQAAALVAAKAKQAKQSMAGSVSSKDTSKTKGTADKDARVVRLCSVP
jgi:hypothetical protein